MKYLHLALVACISIAVALTACNKTSPYAINPPTVALISPANGSTGQSDTVTLSCSAYTGAIAYYFFVTNVSTHSMTQYNSATPIVSPALQAAQTYTWSVTALTADSVQATSPTWSFTTR